MDASARGYLLVPPVVPVLDEPPRPDEDDPEEPGAQFIAVLLPPLLVPLEVELPGTVLDGLFGKLLAELPGGQFELWLELPLVPRLEPLLPAAEPLWLSVEPVLLLPVPSVLEPPVVAEPLELVCANAAVPSDSAATEAAMRRRFIHALLDAKRLRPLADTRITARGPARS